MEKSQISITKTIEMFLENIGLSRSENTEKTYRNAMNAFVFLSPDVFMQHTVAKVRPPVLTDVAQRDAS